MGGGCSRDRVVSLNEMNEGVDFAQRKRFEEAIEHLEKATVLDPTNDQAFSNLGHIHVEMEKFSAAREAFERAAALKPDNAEYQEMLGAVCVKLADWEAAKNALRRASELDASSYRSRFKLGIVYEELDDPQSALYAYTDAVKKGPHVPDSYAALGRLYADLDYLDNASRVLKSGINMGLGSPEEKSTLHQMLGTVYQQRGQFNDAIAEFQKALEFVPGMVDALFSLGWTYALNNQPADAIVYLDKFVKMAGSQAPEYYMRAARDKLALLRADQTPAATE